MKIYRNVCIQCVDLLDNRRGEKHNRKRNDVLKDLIPDPGTARQEIGGRRNQQFCRCGGTDTAAFRVEVQQGDVK